jgi:hydrogenase maturation protein HypF
MIASAPTGERQALRLHVAGVVLGVGFRPFVHRLAHRHGLGGWVRNASGDVEIEIEGTARAVERFVRQLEQDAPPLARVAQVDTRPCRPAGHAAFSIRPSADRPEARAAATPDAAICRACERELFDPTDRRHRYPFITCSDCGPRFSLIESLPYDRERTTMRRFAPCGDCLREYRRLGDRRYHCETTSCPACGPRLWFVGPQGNVAEPAAALAAAAALLQAGGVLALRGLGGFHLAVDATSEPAVSRLRTRKRRERKPLAVMVRTLAEAGALARLTPGARRLLASPERPIVLVRSRPGSPLARAVAPGLSTRGLVLAYTPLHHLLLDLAGCPLVMTSGNASDEPIAAGNEEALDRLGQVADGFLLHDREIVAPTDDSVVRLAGTAPVILRRARGYAPRAIGLPLATERPLLAVGAQLKSTFTLAYGRSAFVSQHIGDLENFETFERYQRMLAHHRGLLRVEPELVVGDLHPGYRSTGLAGELGLTQLAPVQHHHAHIAAVMAEHGVTEPVIGVAYDGTGYGADGHIWGGEILACDLTGFRRLAHLRYAPLPGGDAAARAPWRTVLGLLALEPHGAASFQAAFEGVAAGERAMVERQLAAGFNTPLASSMGRLFDAAAAVLGVRRVNRYEGQAAMELEALAGSRPGRELQGRVVRDGTEGWELDLVPPLIELGERRAGGEPVAQLAADFHATVVAATADLVERAVGASGIRTVALGGGVFQNARLLAGLVARLADGGLTMLLPRLLGPNDGAVSYGQAAVAAARSRG